MKSKQRQRLRGTCQWGGVALCMVIAGMWVFSLRSSLHLLTLSTSPTTAWSIDLCAGMIEAERNSIDLLTGKVSSGYEHILIGDIVWRIRIRLDQGDVDIPLWLPFLLIALPTGYLFWSDHRRRMRSGCCMKCGYDLKGNQSGTCPEYGAGMSDTARRGEGGAHVER